MTVASIPVGDLFGLPFDLVAKATAKSGKGDGNGDGGKSGGKNPSSASSASPATPAGEPGAATEQVDPATGDRVRVRGADISVFHRNGIREIIRGDRFEMRDARGRVIVNRMATRQDRARLDRMRAAVK